ncbi:sigma-70 family RNA polymerase sigma factor [Paenibacillus illinoisensis]|uniref:sigma-70 family RNA polymerase sigma factor n=1 Tax=Paenibacillus illinoisensis TaxID=59845 RepID=UPI003018AC77
MEINEKQINNNVKLAQQSSCREEKSSAVNYIYEKLKPFRYALARKFANKGVEFDDITQQIDLKLLEAIYDYDEAKDPSALRHLVSRTRNGIWNYYRKEMNYFDEDKITISLDALSLNSDMHSRKLGEKSSYYDFIDDKKTFDEDTIIEKIMLEDEMLKLTAHQREVLLMYYVDDKTQYNIAEELQINQANVSRAKKRGVENIRSSITPLGGHDETP